MDINNLVKIAMVGAFATSLGCTKFVGNSGNSTSSQAVQMSRFDVNKYPINKTVCDPLGGGTTVSYTQGLAAQLYYLKSSDPIQYDVEDMIKVGTQSDQSLFFSQLDVPTRLFTAGFPSQSGGILQTDTGENLIEYFALRFNSNLHLGPNDPEGTYEFAVLSDDGSIWSVNMGDGYTTLVNNDGTHPTELGCGNTLNLTQKSQIPMQLDYYQGPRYHIALIPLWRQVAGAPASEPLCGQMGNGLYFDPNNNSTPQQAYMDLLSRGWKPLTQDNYDIPSDAVYNPCTTGTAPAISNVWVAADNEGVMRVTWTTDIPATSQVLYTDVATGVQTLSTADNTLTTNHNVLLTGVPLPATYSVQAVSISATLGKAISAAQQVTN